jgi:hypothetical protein
VPVLELFLKQAKFVPAVTGNVPVFHETCPCSYWNYSCTGQFLWLMRPALPVLELFLWPVKLVVVLKLNLELRQLLRQLNEITKTIVNFCKQTSANIYSFLKMNL